MKKSFNLLFFIIVVIIGSFWFANSAHEEGTPQKTNSNPFLKVEEKKIKVGLQAGHWKNSELPDELENLRLYGGGGEFQGKFEWKINLSVAEKAAEILKKSGIEVDILPATVPNDYKADLFVSIHCDGNDVTSVSGYKVAASNFDKSEQAEKLSESIYDEYGKITKLKTEPNITKDMTEYYVFNYINFHHSINPETPGVIVEMGFLTNTKDQQIIVYNQDLAAKGIAEGILKYLGISS